MKDCDPNTGEADDEGYDDEYVVCTATLYKNLISVLEGWLWVEPHQRHCIVSLIKTLYPLLSTGSTQKDPTDITEKLLTGT